MNITKQQLSEQLAKDAGIPQTVALKVLESLMYRVPQYLQNGHAVTLRGFGIFRTVYRKAKVGRNILRGKSVTIAARDIKTFKFSKSIR